MASSVHLSGGDIHHFTTADATHQYGLCYIRQSHKYTRVLTYSDPLRHATVRICNTAYIYTYIYMYIRALYLNYISHVTHVKHITLFFKQKAWWRHQMETFPALLAICAGNSPHKGQWRGALTFSSICTYINGWVKNREAGDMRRHRAHYLWRHCNDQSLISYALVCLIIYLHPWSVRDTDMTRTAALHFQYG